jgi:hypothetical protein
MLRLDPWHSLTATSVGECEISQRTLAAKYGMPVPCMVSGIVPPSSPIRIPILKLAHILPRSTKAHILRSLGLGVQDVDDLRNMLVLCNGLEEAFDRQFISFVPNTNPFQGGFQVKFWKDEFKNFPLHKGSERTIGEYDRMPLNLSVNGNEHVIFRRALSYQAFMCYVKWKNEKVPGLILPTDCDVSEYVGAYRETKANYLKQLETDIKSEIEQDDDEEDDDA